MIRHLPTPVGRANKSFTLHYMLITKSVSQVLAARFFVYWACSVRLQFWKEKFQKYLQPRLEVKFSGGVRVAGVCVPGDRIRAFQIMSESIDLSRPQKSSKLPKKRVLKLVWAVKSDTASTQLPHYHLCVLMPNVCSCTLRARVATARTKIVLDPHELHRSIDCFSITCCTCVCGPWRSMYLKGASSRTQCVLLLPATIQKVLVRNDKTAAISQTNSTLRVSFPEDRDGFTWILHPQDNVCFFWTFFESVSWAYFAGEKHNTKTPY